MRNLLPTIFFLLTLSVLSGQGYDPQLRLGITADAQFLPYRNEAGNGVGTGLKLGATVGVNDDRLGSLALEVQYGNHGGLDLQATTVVREVVGPRTTDTYLITSAGNYHFWDVNLVLTPGFLRWYGFGLGVGIRSTRINRVVGSVIDLTSSYGPDISISNRSQRGANSVTRILHPANVPFSGSPDFSRILTERRSVPGILFRLTYSLGEYATLRGEYQFDVRDRLPSDSPFGAHRFHLFTVGGSFSFQL